MKMQAVDPAVRILEAEGITCAFGVPGPAINPPPLGIQKARLA
jgi:tartronate-semialdehyde synthase